MKIRKLCPSIWVLFLILWASCSSEDVQDTALTSDIVLRFESQNVESRTNGSVDPGVEQENRIDKLFIWFFTADADDTANPLCFFEAHDLASNSKATVTLTEKMLGDAGADINGKYSLYVAANPLESANDVKNLTLGALKKHTFGASSRPGATGTYFSMSGTVQNHDFSKSHTLTIPLTRQAVKLGIKLINETSESTWTIESVSVRSDQKKVAMFEQVAGTTLDSDTFTDDLTVSATATTDSPASYSTYIYENLSDDPTIIEVKATVGGDTRTYVAEIKPEGAATLLRNSACMVTLRLKDADVDVKLEISEWIPLKVTAPILGTYLTVGKKVCEVDIADGGDLFVGSDAQSINVDWSNSTGIYLQGYQSAEKADVQLANSGVNLYFTADVMQNNISGYILIKAGNITKKILVEKKLTLLQFDNFKVQINSQDITDLSEYEWNISTLGSIVFSVNRNVAWYYTYRRFTAEEPITPIDADVRGFNSVYSGIDGPASLSWKIPNNTYGKDIRVYLTAGLGTFVSGTEVWSYSFIIKKKP